MTKNLMKLLFLSTLLMGTILSMSSNSLFGVWMGLEMNLLSFISLLTNNKNMMMNESSIKYFIVQAMASTMLLFSMLLIQLNYLIELVENNILAMMISSSLLLKIGAAPFHFWLPEVMNMSSWMNCLILLTWQKIAPMTILSYCCKASEFMMTIAIISITIGAMGGLNQTSIRQLMAYSSISHLGWMISSMMISENTWEIYLVIYSVLTSTIVLTMNKFNSSYMNQIYSNNISTKIKMLIMMSILSLGGLPPFMGFLPKWMVIQNMMENKLTSLITIMVVLTSITLYYYMRISFSALILNNTENKWIIKLNNNSQMFSMSILTTMSMMGLILTSTLMLFY